jgi:hypothetical protein
MNRFRPVLIPVEVVCWAWGVRADDVLHCIEDGRLQAFDIRSGGARAEWRIWSGTLFAGKPASAEQIVGYRTADAIRYANVASLLWIGRPHLDRLVRAGELEAEREPLRITRASLVAFLERRASI